tara:strand:+ start:3363 stop:4682 length:1320 start_codon:yes stop_codon:yes gene_type:complete
MKTNNQESINYVLNQASENKVKFIRLWFTDLFGNIKGFGITDYEFEKVLKEGMSFDGSSIFGSERSNETEMIAFPDPTTFQILPWRPDEPSVAKINCDILNKDGSPSNFDSRHVLKNKVKELVDKGLNFYIAPEIEYFYLESSNSMKPIDEKTYFDQIGIHGDLGSDLRRNTVLGLEKMGIPIQKFHHEVSPGQQEISLRYSDSVTIADSIQTFKIIVKEIAMLSNVFATFMPKPFENFEGNGMHLHISLFKDDKNLFSSNSLKSGISKDGEYFTAGLLKHSLDFMLISNQWVNSYKRIVAENESPSHNSWSNIPNNFNAITIPKIRKGSEESSRIEFRVPDPGCNPYLTFASIINAGLKGIKDKYKLEKPSLSKSDLKLENLLPSNLGIVLNHSKNNLFLKEVLSDEALEIYIKGKETEWNAYSKYVSEFELNNWLIL